MPIASISIMGGGGQWGRARFVRHQGNDDKSSGVTKDKLVARQEKREAKGKDTSHLDKVIEYFDDIDSDHNGRISRDELHAASKTLGIELPPKSKRREQREALEAETKNPLSNVIEQMKAQGKDPADIEKLMRQFQKMDADKDHKISFDEFQEGAAKFGFELKGPDGEPRKLMVKTESESRLSKMINQYKQTDPDMSNDPLFVSVTA